MSMFLMNWKGERDRGLRKSEMKGNGVRENEGDMGVERKRIRKTEFIDFGLSKRQKRVSSSPAH